MDNHISSGLQLPLLLFLSWASKIETTVDGFLLSLKGLGTKIVQPSRSCRVKEKKGEVVEAVHFFSVPEFVFRSNLKFSANIDTSNGDRGIEAPDMRLRSCSCTGLTISERTLLRA